jgi:hemerythrin superfamily protein
MMDSTERSVISVLTRDHRQIEELLARLQTATDPEECRRLIDEVTTEVVQHADAEEMYLYQTVREAIPDGAVNIEKEIAAHVKIKEVLEELKRTNVADPKFKALLTELIAAVHQDIINEEHSVFPWFAQWVDEIKLEELGDQVQALRNKAPASTPDDGLAH